MDPAKADLVTVCARLARLQLRLLSAHWAAAPGRCPTIEDFIPTWSWLDAVPSRTALSGVIYAVTLAQAHLLAMADSAAPIDAREACRALQRIQCSSSVWGTPTLRLAARLGYKLAESPLAEFHGADVSERDLPPGRGSPTRSAAMG